jgi:hypothetical protein
VNTQQLNSKADTLSDKDNVMPRSLTANNLLSPAFLQSLDWWQLYKVAEPLVAKICDKKLHEKLLEIYPIEEGQEYVGSLCNHYRGRLRNEGKFALIDQMCSNSMRHLILGLSS